MTMGGMGFIPERLLMMMTCAIYVYFVPFISILCYLFVLCVILLAVDGRPAGSSERRNPSAAVFVFGSSWLVETVKANSILLPWWYGPTRLYLCPSVHVM